MPQNNKYYIGFEQLLTDVARLAEKVANSGINYDAIVAIAGGGLVPARLLRNFLHLPIYSVNIKTYDGEEKSGKIDIIQWLGKSECGVLSGKNILFVDDLDDTRGTLEHFVNMINDDYEGFHGGEIGFALLYNKIKEKCYNLPDKYHYYSAKDVENRWIVFPWE